MIRFIFDYDGMRRELHSSARCMLVFFRLDDASRHNGSKGKINEIERTLSLLLRNSKNSKRIRRRR